MGLSSLLSTPHIRKIFIKKPVSVASSSAAFTTSREGQVRDQDFTDKVLDALMAADKVALKNKHHTVDREHLMKALLDQNFGRARRILREAGLDYNIVLRATIAKIDRLPQVIGESAAPMRGPKLEKLIKQARKYMKEFDDSFLSVEHLILAFAHENWFEELHMDVQLSHKTLTDAIQSVRGHRRVIDRDPEGKYNVLVKYGIDFTARAKAGKLDPVIGRDAEIERCFVILSKRVKANPVLVGEPGVGKTAVVEGIAQLLADGSVPKDLMNCKLICLDMGELIAGTNGHGEFESRLKAVIKEVTDSEGQIILFIDEFHTIIGAGGSTGSMDASNLLKPMLARGEIRCIGATTFNEYRKYVEKDPALERRFEKVVVKQPSVEETISILQGLRKGLELHHGVQISDDALTSAASLSERYITDRFLPDKAIDLVDEAAAGLQSSLKLETTMESSENGIIVTQDDIAEIVSKQTRVPVSKLQKNDKQSILALEEELKKHIVGQDLAIRVVAEAIKRSRTGLSDPQRPIASFVFLGPTGVGKTELAKALAINLFDAQEALVRIDMSEYMEKHSVSRLIGAPPGYVGYEERGYLTEIIHWKPYAVILLDEIEKAHRDVLKVFLQILDEGRLTDSHGHTVNFKNTLILMTSNVGSQFILDIGDGGEREQMDYETIKKAVMTSLKSVFLAEFINRVDDFIVFQPLNREKTFSIVKIQLEKLGKRMADKNMKIHFSDASIQYLATVGYDVNYGARPVKRAIQKYVENELADGILREDFNDGDTISVDIEVEAFDSTGQPPMEKLVFKRED